MTIKNGDMPAMPMQATNKLIEMVSTCESDSALDSYISTFGGLTKREQFAMAAMQGMLSHATRYKPREGASENWHEAISEEAVQLADALLAELDKAGGE